MHPTFLPRKPKRVTRIMTTGDPRVESQRRFGHAWVSLSIALACHVLDEALTDFLGVYNPLVRELRSRYPWFPMPEFTFGIWLTGLCLLVLVLLAVSPFAYRRSWTLQLVAYPFAGLMLLNGIGHLAASVYLARWAPGATTAPLLIAASTWLVVALRTR